MTQDNPGDWTVSSTRGTGMVSQGKGIGRVLTAHQFGEPLPKPRRVALVKTNVPSGLNPKTLEPYFKSGFHEALVPCEVREDGSIDFDKSHPMIREAIDKKGCTVILDPTEADMDDIHYEPTWSIATKEEIPEEGREYVAFGEPARKQMVRQKAQSILRRQKEEAEINALEALVDSESEDAQARVDKKLKLQEHAAKMREAKAAKAAKANTSMNVNNPSPTQNETGLPPG